MRIDNLSEQQLENIFNNLNKYVNTNYQQVWTRYVKLGSKTVRIICYSDEFTPLVERQLTFTLSDCADSYDSTLVIWKEKNIFAVPKMLDSVFDPKVNIRLRIDMLYSTIMTTLNSLGLLPEQMMKMPSMGKFMVAQRRKKC